MSQWRQDMHWQNRDSKMFLLIVLDVVVGMIGWGDQRLIRSKR